MGIDYVFSIAYWVIWGIWIIPMVYIIAKSVTKGHNSRDWYSILTFLFILLMLFLRTFSIIPQLIHGEELSVHGNEWEQAIFIGTPMLIFCLAVFVHSIRWFELLYKLVRTKSFPTFYKILMGFIIIFNFWLLGVGYSTFWLNWNEFNIKEIYVYFVILFYLITYLKLVSINVYLIYAFRKEVSKKHVKIYKNIKNKLNFYFVFIILLLTLRLIFIIPIIIEYFEDIELIKSSLHTTILLFLEILPILLLMLSFVVFGSSSNDRIESTKERLSHFFSVSRDSPKYKELFSNDSADLFINSNSLHSNEDEK